MSRRCSVRWSPSWRRAKSWIWSRISALEGRSSGLTPPRQSRLAALRLAVKYSDSTRSYISRAASRAIAWRSLALAILSCAVIKPIERRGASCIIARANTAGPGEIRGHGRSVSSMALIRSTTAQGGGRPLVRGLGEQLLTRNIRPRGTLGLNFATAAARRGPTRSFVRTSRCPGTAAGPCTGGTARSRG